jgi:hypothetical protein
MDTPGRGMCVLVWDLSGPAPAGAGAPGISGMVVLDLRRESMTRFRPAFSAMAAYTSVKEALLAVSVMVLPLRGLATAGFAVDGMGWACLGSTGAAAFSFSMEKSSFFMVLSTAQPREEEQADGRDHG